MDRVSMTWPQYLRKECSVVVDGREMFVPITAQQCEILLIVLLNHPRPVRRVAIIEFLWNNPDLEPDWADAIILRQVFSLNARLKHIGVISRRKNVGYQIGMLSDYNRKYKSGDCSSC